MLEAERERLRKLFYLSSPGAPLGSLLKETAPRLYEAIRLQQITLRLERADCESQLAGRKKAGGTTADQDRKEIRQLEEHQASLIAREKILTDELAHMERQMHDAEGTLAESARTQAEINANEEASRRMGREIQKFGDRASGTRASPDHREGRAVSSMRISRAGLRAPVTWPGSSRVRWQWERQE